MDYQKAYGELEELICDLPRAACVVETLNDNDLLHDDRDGREALTFAIDVLRDRTIKLKEAYYRLVDEVEKAGSLQKEAA